MLASVAGGVIALLLWPFPADGNAALFAVALNTALAVAVAVVAAIAAWLTDKRHPGLWIAEFALAAAITAALFVGLLAGVPHGA